MRSGLDLTTQFPCLLQAEADMQPGKARVGIKQLLQALVLDLARQGVAQVDYDRRGMLHEVSVVDQGRWDRAVGSMFCGRYLDMIADASGIACAVSAGQVAPLREMLQWLETAVLGVDMRLRLARERPRAWARRA